MCLAGSGACGLDACGVYLMALDGERTCSVVVREHICLSIGGEHILWWGVYLMALDGERTRSVVVREHVL